MKVREHGRWTRIHHIPALSRPAVSPTPEITSAVFVRQPEADLACFQATLQASAEKDARGPRDGLPRW